MEMFTHNSQWISTLPPKKKNIYVYVYMNLFRIISLESCDLHMKDGMNEAYINVESNLVWFVI